MSRDIEKCHTTCLRHVWHVLCRDIFSETGDILDEDIINIEIDYMQNGMVPIIPLLVSNISALTTSTSSSEPNTHFAIIIDGGNTICGLIWRFRQLVCSSILYRYPHPPNIPVIILPSFLQLNSKPNMDHEHSSVKWFTFDIHHNLSDS